jgi:pyridinium-3,5-biscarboxylic acid mononucleotide synthase
VTDFVFDAAREARIGLPEAVYAEGKSVAQLAAILADATAHGRSLLLTRLDAAKRTQLDAPLDYDALSRTAYFGTPRPLAGPARVAVVSAGTSDAPVAHEAARTLRFHGEDVRIVGDVGVAGLWRLLARVDELRAMPVLIVAAGMDAALPSVVAGLVGGAIVAVPTSVGYGVAAGGRAALDALLASCAPGLAVVNIDNGYGAACAALRILNAPR